VTDSSILVVEDDANLAYVLTRLLERNGYQVVSAVAGTQGVNKYRRGNFDLALVDYRLPDIDGLVVLDEIRRFDPEARVVLMSAYGDKETVVQAFRLGAVEYLEKPFENQTLLDMVDKLLQGEQDSLQGSLEMMSLASIIQLNCEERNQSRLRIRRQGREGLIYFKDGEVVHAEVGTVTGERAVYELLSWDRGRFQMEQGISPPLRTVNTGWSGLLLEGMRRIDETGEGLDPDWDEQDEQPDPQQAAPDSQTGPLRLARALKGVNGVLGVMICSLANDDLIVEQDVLPEQQPMLTKFLVQRALSLGRLIKAGDPQRLVLKGAEQTTLIIARGTEIIKCDLSPRASVDSVWKSLQTVLRRYRLQD
jgi:CheY-like chemotaxis protein